MCLLIGVKQSEHSPLGAKFGVAPSVKRETGGPITHVLNDLLRLDAAPSNERCGINVWNHLECANFKYWELVPPKFTSRHTYYTLLP